jgi:hypothetical protein
MIGVRDVMARKRIKIGRGVKRKTAAVAWNKEQRHSGALFPRPLQTPFPLSFRTPVRNLQSKMKREAAADTKRSLVTPFLLGMTKGPPATEKQCG